MVESIKVRIGDGRRMEVDPLAKVVEIDWSPTTRSRSASGASLNETSLWIYRETSEPPKVRLPKTPLDPEARYRLHLSNTEAK